MNTCEALSRDTIFGSKNDYRVKSNTKKNILVKRTRWHLTTVCCTGVAVIICTTHWKKSVSMCHVFTSWVGSNCQNKVRVVLCTCSFSAISVSRHLCRCLCSVIALSLGFYCVSNVFYCRLKRSFRPTCDPTVNTGSESEPGGSQCQAVSSNVLG